ncbi:16S rRNA (uracil(1498)-N(3))-methyltransferase [Azovibrio restrictus]|uniref:16S rRNA (uracil(1498)-N(3))-methyltransferase n=1 Tax=Azovibrio restrictus TaxID=146938 RepID=UPI0026E948A2|nr:16S rRNA (uracil(1498)-N(3))-methyltransferase [Azovibrio restrictus]
MNSPRFFCDTPLSPGACFDLPEAVARHAVRVLRLPPGAGITLFDGQGGEYAARITRITRERVAVSIGGWEDVERESPLQLTLVQAIQAADKMDYTIQKAVELGISAIQPVASRRSVVKLSGERQQKREAHWQSVAISACEQCGRNRVPPVAPVQSLDLWLAGPGKAREGLKLMLAPGAGHTLHQLPPAGQVILLVGAEGGLEPGEMRAAAQAGFVPVSLGPRILRTETAGLAALAAIQTLWGDFKGE